MNVDDNLHPRVLEFQRILKHSGYNQKTLGEKCKLRPSIFNNWLKGRNNPSLIPYEKALNVMGYELIVRKRQ